MPNMQKAKKVLVVDDEVHIVNIVAMKFRQSGFEVHTARDPQEALEIAQQEVPDLVIADHQMPGGSGIDLCKALKTTVATKDVPAILLTAYDFSIVQEALGDCNVRAVMAKPFSPRELLTRANELLASSLQS